MTVSAVFIDYISTNILFNSASADAAVDYKKVLIEDLKKDPRVEVVDDFGAKDISDKTR